MFYDEGQAIAEKCPACGSTETSFDAAFGFWKCENCSTVWGHDQDDPDYDEPGILAAGALVDAGLYAAPAALPPIPQRKYEFGDLAVVAMTSETGEVVGIWWMDSKKLWKYRLRGLSRFGAIWWSEDQLQRPGETPEAKPLNEQELIEAWDYEPGCFNRMHWGEDPI